LAAKISKSGDLNEQVLPTLWKLWQTKVQGEEQQKFGCQLANNPIYASAEAKVAKSALIVSEEEIRH